VGTSSDDGKEELARAARLVEETISALGISPATVRMTPPAAGGFAWSLMRGSAALAIFVRPPRANEDGPFLRVISPMVMVDTSRELELYRKLLELNASGLSSVAFGLHDGRIVAVSERPTRDLDASEVRFIVQIVGAVADHYDDDIIKNFGGKRVSDKR
jgi:hypothetical protein